MAAETLVRGALPRVQWGPVAAGTLCAIASHIVLGLFGVAFGLAAEPSDSAGVGVVAGVWGLLVPFASSFIGAYVCVRLARETDAAGAYLHGSLVWCIGLIAGALFLTGSLASGMMSAATALGGNADVTQRQIRSEQRRDTVAGGGAAASGAAGLGAILGLCGACVGAALGRRALTGAGMGRGRGPVDRPSDPSRRVSGYREEMGTTGAMHDARAGLPPSPRAPPAHAENVGDDDPATRRH